MAKSMTIDLDSLASLGKEIAEIDTRIGAASGSESAVRKRVAESFAVENAAEVEKIVDAIAAQLNKYELPVVIGVIDKLEDHLQDTFSGAADELIEERVKALTADSKEDVSGLREQRKQKNEMFKALRLLLEQQFGIDTKSVPDPKRGGGRPPGSSTGATPKKDGYNKEWLRYSIDGKERPASQNSFSSVAYHATAGCPTDDGTPRWGAKQLRTWLEEQGVKVGSAEDGGQDEWSVTLPNGKTLSARRLVEGEFPRATDEETQDEAQEETQPEEAA